MDKTRNSKWGSFVMAALFFVGIGFAWVAVEQESAAIGQEAVEQETPPDPFTLTGQRIAYVRGTANYTITVANPTDNPQQQTRVVVELPSSLEYVSAEPNGISTPAKGDKPATIVWQPSDIEPGGQTVITFKARALARDTAEIAATCESSIAVVPLTSHTTTRLICLPALDIRTVDTTDPAVDQTAFVVEVASVGDTVCSSVALRYEIPAPLEFVSATGGKYEIEDNQVVFEGYPILSPGEKIKFKVVCKVIGSGMAIHKASITFDQIDRPITIEEATTCIR